MKIRKPDDEKYFKDIVLNDILGEISNENQDVPNAHLSKNRASTKNKFSIGKIFTIGLSIFLLLFIVLLFNLDTETKPTEKHTSQKPTIDKQEWKMEKDRNGYTENLPIKVVKKKTIPRKEVLLKPIKIEPIPIQKTERELAKEALRQQILN